MEKVSFRKEAINRYDSPETTIEFEPTTHCNFIDIIQHVRNGTREAVCDEGSLDDENINAWLTKDIGQKDGKRFAGGLRLIYGVCGFPEGRRSMPFTASVYHTMERILGVNDEFKKILMGTTSRAVKFSVEDDDGTRPRISYIFKFSVFRPVFYVTFLSHSPHTNLTHAIVLSQTSDHKFPAFLDSLKKHQRYANHPLLTPSLIAPIVLASTAKRVATLHQGMDKIEESLGQHEFENVPVTNPLDLSNADFLTIGRRLSWCGTILGVERLRACAMGGTLEMMLSEIREEEERKREERIAKREGSENDDFRRFYNVSRNMVKEKLVAELNASENLVMRVGYEQARRAIKSDVVYQFMAQKEAITNGQVARTSAIIAQESRKDSSAMKAIAVLTMFFLPGTFLAAIFAMPVFNWQDPSVPIVKQGFVVYCAIGVPLTVFVLAIWGLAVWVPWERFSRRRSAGMGMEGGLEINKGGDRVLWEGVQVR